MTTIDYGLYRTGEKPAVGDRVKSHCQPVTNIDHKNRTEYWPPSGRVMAIFGKTVQLVGDSGRWHWAARFDLVEPRPDAVP